MIKGASSTDVSVFVLYGTYAHRAVVRVYTP